MKKIMIVCENGLGSSFMVEMNVKKILKNLGKEAEVVHMDLTSAQSEDADLYIGDKQIVENLENGKRNIIGLDNLLDNEKITEILKENV